MSKRDRDRQRQRESARPQTPVLTTEERVEPTIEEIIEPVLEERVEQQPIEASEAAAHAALDSGASGQEGGSFEPTAPIELTGDSEPVPAAPAPTEAVGSTAPAYVHDTSDAPLDPNTPIVSGQLKKVEVVNDPNRRVRVRALASMVLNWGSSHFAGQEFSMREEDALRALEKGAIEIIG